MILIIMLKIKIILQDPNLLPELHKILFKVGKIVVAHKRSTLKTDSSKYFYKDEDKS